MKPPNSKSALHRAAAGEGSLDAALRGRPKIPADLLAEGRGGDQSVISEILAGRHSTLDTLAVGEPLNRSSERTVPRLAADTRDHTDPRQPETAAVPIRTIADLGALVKSARRRLSLPQQRFADLAGVGRRFVSELEAGKPTLETDRVLRCCLAAGIDILARPRNR